MSRIDAAMLLKAAACDADRFSQRSVVER